MLRAAIEHFRKEKEQERLKKSADLYAEVYSEDEDLRELTETAVNGWPEWMKGLLPCATSPGWPPTMSLRKKNCPPNH